MGFGKLFMLNSSNARIDFFKVIPELDDIDTAELFRFPIPFVLLVKKFYFYKIIFFFFFNVS